MNISFLLNASCRVEAPPTSEFTDIRHTTYIEYSISSNDLVGQHGAACYSSYFPPNTSHVFMLNGTYMYILLRRNFICFSTQVFSLYPTIMSQKRATYSWLIIKLAYRLLQNNWIFLISIKNHCLSFFQKNSKSCISDCLQKGVILQNRTV